MKTLFIFLFMTISALGQTVEQQLDAAKKENQDLRKKIVEINITNNVGFRSYMRLIDEIAIQRTTIIKLTKENQVAKDALQKQGLFLDSVGTIMDDKASPLAVEKANHEKTKALLDRAYAEVDKTKAECDIKIWNIQKDIRYLKQKIESHENDLDAWNNWAIKNGFKGAKNDCK